MNPAAPLRLRFTAADRWLLAAIVVFAALLRLWDLPLISITADEGLHGLFARYVTFGEFERLPLVGLPSVGVRNSALFIYLLAIPNLIVMHPLSGAVLVALLQVAAIALTYRYALRWFGRTAALTACVLWTFSPWGVIYARNMWPPSALAPFVLLLLGAATHWFVHGDRRSLGWSVFLSFLVPQVHFSGFCAPVYIGLLIVVRLKRLDEGDWKTLVVAAVIGLATWTPWIYWQHFENNWMDLKQIGVAAAGKAEFSYAALVGYFRDIFHTSGLDYWFRTPESELPEYFPAWLAPTRLIVGWSLELAFVVSGLWATRFAVGRLLLLWCFLPLVHLTLLRPQLHPHYEYLAYPAPYLLIGLAAQTWLRSPAARAVGAGCLVGVAIVFALTINGWRRYIADDRLDGGDRYQLSYRQRWTAVDAVIDDANGKQIEVAGPFSGQQPAYMLLHMHESARRGKGRWPRDLTHVYWMDELQGDSLPERALADLGAVWPFLRDVKIERKFQVGPTRVFLLVGRPGGRSGGP